MIEDRREIALRYLKGWFIIDVIVTLPYDLITASFQGDSGSTNYAYMAKIIRIIKIVRLIRLLKLLKVARDRERIHALISTNKAYSSALERLMMSVIGFFLLCHVIACIWIIQANLQRGQLVEGQEPVVDNWIAKHVEDPKNNPW